MTYTFDGINKIIIISTPPTLGGIDVDIRDLYSRWIDWTYISDNSKFLQALRSVGGDPLPGSKQLGLTYFLLNGWKIRPYEQSHVFTLNGNLYSEDGSSPFTSTIGAYNVTIINSVSNLVDSTVQQLPEIEHSSFNERVTIDVDNGVAGTLYPIGTSTNPVNNIIDAKIIANYRGFKHIELNSDITITTGQNIDELHFSSDNWRIITIESGVSTRNTNFDRLSIYGEMDGFWNILNDCWVYELTNFCGWLRRGSFVNIELAPYTVESLGQSYFDDIVPMYPNQYSNITCNVNTDIAISSYTGRLNIKSMDDDCVVEVGFRTGKLNLDNSNIGGILKVRGVCELVDNSNGTVVDDDTLNVVTITDGVWNEQTSNHQVIGSTGKALTSAGAAGDPWTTELPGTYIEGQAGYEMAALVNKADELHKLQGLNPQTPMTVTTRNRTAGTINLNISGDGETTTTVTRT